MCPLLKALLLPASPPCVRSFAYEHKTRGVPSVPGCLENGGVRAGSTHLVGVITLQVAGALRHSLGTVCVSVCACMGLCLLDLGTVPLSAPCQALCHSKNTPNSMG